MIRTLARRAALAAVPLMMLATVPGTASAVPIFKSASINVHQSAQLVTTPTAGINVTVNYSCAPLSPGEVFVGVSQNGGFVGTGEATATCDDKTHLLTILVPGAFTTGPANAEGFVYNADGSATAEQLAEISIK